MSLTLKATTPAEMADFFRRLANQGSNVRPITCGVDVQKDQINATVTLSHSEELPPSEPQSTEDGPITDKSGAIWDTGIHSKSSDGKPVFNADGRFKARRKKKVSKETSTPNPDAGTTSGPDTEPTSTNDTSVLNRFSKDGEANDQAKETGPVYICRNAAGSMFPGSSVPTAREFAEKLIDLLTAAPDQDARIVISNANEPVLDRLEKEGHEGLIQEIGNACAEDVEFPEEG